LFEESLAKQWIGGHSPKPGWACSSLFYWPTLTYFMTQYATFFALAEPLYNQQASLLFGKYPVPLDDSCQNYIWCAGVK